jgi:hypothetical protein
MASMGAFPCIPRVVPVTKRRVVLPFLLLLSLPIGPAAQAGAQSVGGVPGLAPVAPEAAEPLTLRQVSGDPLLHHGRSLSLDAQVVRSTRLLVTSDVAGSLLLRDDAGDTVAVLDPDTLPPVGSRVRVSGTIRADSNGAFALVGGGAGLSVQVLGIPDTAVESAGAEPLDGRTAQAGACADAEGTLGALSCSVSGLPLPVLGGATVVLILAVTGVVLLLRRHPEEEESDDGADIPLIFSLTGSRPSPPAAADVPAGTALQPISWPAGGPTPMAQQAQAAQAQEAQEAQAQQAQVNGGGVVVQEVAPAVVQVPRLPLVSEPERSFSGAMSVSSSEILQLLPGRLELIDGAGIEPEIRFFRVSSLEVPEITFGRSDGPPYRHIQLPASTVSRLHARLRFTDRQWRISNLSSMNPVTVNDLELGGSDEERPLEEGDRIRIGDYLFRYRNGKS